MNKTERRYENNLAMRQLAGEITGHWYESVKLKIGAHRCWYTPDFLVALPNGRMEIHEVKGFLRDDARVKLQVVSDKYPQFGLVVVRWHNGWHFERISGRQP